jgi:hypothetical protein
MARVTRRFGVLGLMVAVLLAVAGGGQVAVAEADVCVSIFGDVKVEEGTSTCESDATSKAIAVNDSTARAGANSQAIAINDSDAVAGWYSEATAINDSRAFALTYSEATAINGSSQCVINGIEVDC